MEVDANGVLEVKAEELRSGAKAMIRINSTDCKNSLIKIERY
jgi:hypothetical protein